LWRSGLSGSVLPMKIAILQRGSVALYYQDTGLSSTRAMPSSACL
jgi:hypothetical protein